MVCGYRLRKCLRLMIGHVYAFCRGTHLSGIDQTSMGDRLNGRLNISIWGDDESIFAAQLQVGPLDALGRKTGYALCPTDTDPVPSANPEWRPWPP